jgi:hypothetical protein
VYDLAMRRLDLAPVLAALVADEFNEIELPSFDRTATVTRDAVTFVNQEGGFLLALTPEKGDIMEIAGLDGAYGEWGSDFRAWAIEVANGPEPAFWREMLEDLEEDGEAAETASFDLKRETSGKSSLLIHRRRSNDASRRARRGQAPKRTAWRTRRSRAAVASIHGSRAWPRAPGRRTLSPVPPRPRWAAIPGEATPRA